MSGIALLIDLGNTRLKWSLAEGGRLLESPSAIVWPGGELPMACWSAMGVTNIVMASVAGVEATSEAVRRISQLGAKIRQVATDAAWQGLRCAYPEPSRLGVDRWLALIAAYRMNPPGRCLVVSAGTALTIDALDPGGRHRGGIIVPGLAAMRDGLIAAAPGLAAYRDGKAGTGLATDSADAIASGCLQVALALIERHRGEGDSPGPVLLSGGDADVLTPHVRRPCQLKPWLVLEGLAMWAHVADGGTFDR